MSQSHLELARDKLNPNNLQCGLPGRDQQIETIYNFLYQRLKVKGGESSKAASIKSRHDNKTIFICGVPGTGKTASVNLVLDQLRELRTQSIKKKKTPEINAFDVINVNAQHLSTADRVYSEIYYMIYKKNLSGNKAQEKLEALFRPGGKTTKTTNYTVIIIDELDMLYSERREDILYNLFDWPTSSASRVILIAIANAMDLPERVQSKIASRLGWEKLVFEPYKSDNLEHILTSRLGTSLMSKCFDRVAVSVATKRIGRTTGDARRILDICRLAINLAIKRKEQKVTGKMIDEVGFDRMDHQRAEYLENIGSRHMAVLKSILLATINYGEENVNASVIMKQLYKLSEAHPALKNEVFGLDEVQSTMNELAGAGFLYLEHGKPMNKKRIYLKDPSDVTKDLIKKSKIIRL